MAVIVAMIVGRYMSMQDVENENNPIQ